MLILIYGSKGWIGKQFIKLLNDKNIPYKIGEKRLENKENIKKELIQSKCTHVISFTGRTHGIYNGELISTIDYLEYPGKLVDNMRDNYVGPVNLAELTKELKIHYTYLGTGCIFKYDEKHALDSNSDITKMIGFTEEDKPNFFGSSYSIVKGFTDTKMKEFGNVLNLRIRMPITKEQNSRNFITKITTYEKICSIPNSMTVLDDLLPIILHMAIHSETGTYNMTNPGVIEHNEILEMYKKYKHPDFKWCNFTIKEQDKILRSERSNNYLDTKKIEKYCKTYNLELLNITDDVKKILN